MPFSEHFSAGFNKTPYVPPETTPLGTLTSEYYAVFGEESIIVLKDEFNAVVGDWNLGNYPP